MNNEILKTLEQIKNHHPYLRIGQIISIALPRRFENDCFSISDEELLKCLKQSFKEIL